MKTSVTLVWPKHIDAGSFGTFGLVVGLLASPQGGRGKRDTHGDESVQRLLPIKKYERLRGKIILFIHSY